MGDGEAAVGRALDGMPFTRFHGALIATLSVVGFLEAYATAVTGALLVSVRGAMPVSPLESRLLVIAPTVTLVLTMLLTSTVLADRFGRRSLLLTGVVWSAAGTLATVAATGPVGLIALRAVSGIGYGLALPAAYPIGAELLPARRRSTFAWIYEVCQGIGFTLTSVVGYLVAHAGVDGGWRLLLLPGGLCVLFAPFLIVRCVPESPRRLAALGRTDAAWRIVERMGGAGPRDAPAPVPEPGASGAAGVPGGARHPLLLASLVWLCAMVPFYIFSTLLPEILVHRSFTVAASFAFTIVIFGVTLPGKLLNGWLMERFGRRFAISASFALAAVAVALLFTATGTVTLVIGEVLAGLSIMSAFPAVRMYMAEQFPTRTRGRGYTFAEFIGRFIAGIPLPFLLAGLVGRPADIMWCALVFVVAGAVVPWAMGRDTRGALTEEPATRVAHQPG